MSKHKHKKQFGQNFLNDNQVLEDIIKVSGVTHDVNVLEIGPGDGALTNLLVDKAAEVISIEIDRDLVKYLQKIQEKNKNFSFINEDFLKLKASNITFKTNNKLIVVANLPYYITTPIIEKLIKEYTDVKEIYVMVQDEVAKRICANPKTKAYGSLSVYLQMLTKTNYEFQVDASKFEPIPKVNSAIVSLKKKNKQLEPFTEKFVYNIFKQKRKTLANNLKNSYPLSKEEIAIFLVENDLQPTSRAEEIAVDKIAELAQNLDKYLIER